jgi:ubiquinone/menaquinone biosynthesis C-methylase UbiE
MPTPKEKHPSTYFVQPREQKHEFQRLTIQGQMLTRSLGGPLSEQADPGCFRRALDVGCGTGDWIIATAHQVPTLELTGIDINPLMIDYASAQAANEQLTERVFFRVMDALKPLDFPDATFDLVNQRLGQSYVRVWEWPALLHEYLRICQPGGSIRLSEAETVTSSNSQSVVKLGSIFTQALYQAGHYFSPASDGITSHLTRLLQQAGVREVELRPYVLECRAGTAEGESFAMNVRHLFRSGLPFFQKWTQVPENYEEIYQQALDDMQQPSFVATWNVYTAWGKK